MGYLNEYSTYLKYESIAEGIRTTWVLDFWPLSLIEDALVGIVQWAYDNVYQSAYNYGADKGNQINNTVLGWVEDAKKELENLISTTKTRIQTELIDPLNAQVQRLKNDLNLAEGKLADLDNTLIDFKSRANGLLRDHESRIKALEAKLRQTPLGMLEKMVKGAKPKI